LVTLKTGFSVFGGSLITAPVLTFDAAANQQQLLLCRWNWGIQTSLLCKLQLLDDINKYSTSNYHISLTAQCTIRNRKWNY